MRRAFFTASATSSSSLLSASRSLLQPGGGGGQSAFAASSFLASSSFISLMRFASSSSSSTPSTTTSGKKSKKSSSKKNKDKQQEEDKDNAEVSPTNSTTTAAKKPQDDVAKTTANKSDKNGDALESKQPVDDDISTELEVEAVRWEVPEVTDRTVDEKGQYIVSKTPWTKRGELAYSTPPAPGPLEARFGYQIVVVKRPQSYWQWYRRQIDLFSWSHLMYQMTFCLAVAWLIAWVQLETDYLYKEMKKPGNLAGDVYGKGDPNLHQKKITVSAEERDEVMGAMQMAFMDGKDMASRATKDYKMKKIPRPKDFKVEDYLRSG